MLGSFLLGMFVGGVVCIVIAAIFAEREHRKTQRELDEDEQASRLERREAARATSLGRDRLPMTLPDKPPAPAPVPKVGCRSGRCRTRHSETNAAVAASDPLTSLLVANELFESMKPHPTSSDPQPPQIDPPSELSTSQFEAAAESYECPAPDSPTFDPPAMDTTPSDSGSFSSGDSF